MPGSQLGWGGGARGQLAAQGESQESWLETEASQESHPILCLVQASSELWQVPLGLGTFPVPLSPKS